MRHADDGLSVYSQDPVAHFQLPTSVCRAALDYASYFMGHSDDGGVLRSVQGADDDEAEALILLAVNNHITGLQGASLWRRGGSWDGDHRRARS